MAGRLSGFFLKMVSSFFFVGYLPVPGTFGSLAGLGIYFLLNGSPVPVLAACGACLLVGWAVCGAAERAFGKKDPSHIVIDEVAGILLALVFVPFDLKLVIIGFFFFRLLDTLKPFPCGRIQDLHGASGIMLDDVVAALYTNLILQIIARLI
jgi:phosphatidylglycerophosphatase A